MWGRTGNAHHPHLSAGGSSGDAAVALARYMLPLADGSDAMGSLRNPGAWNQVYGFRPSLHLIAQDPSTADLFTQGIAVEGPMARTPHDLEVLLRAMVDYEPRVPYHVPLGSSGPEVLPARIRVGWLSDLGHLPIEPDLLQFTHDATYKMATLTDVSVENVSVDFDWDALWTAWLNVRHAAAATSMEAVGVTEEQRRTHFQPEANWEVDQGRHVTVSDLAHAQRVRTSWWRTLVHLFGRYDFLVLPTTQTRPFPLEWD